MNERYTTDIKYPPTYFHFQTPIIMSAVALLTGHAHRFPGPGFTYCDFGCGQGYMLSLLAACNPDAKFFGVDINPDHIASAQQLVDQFGLDNVTLINADFLDLKPEDLPDLDYAAITGVYSWLPGNSRTRLIEYVSSRLKDGGLCFLHYLTMPGLGRTMATTALTQLLSERQSGDSATRAVAAVSELHGVLESNPQLPFNLSSPETRNALSKQLNKEPGELAHDVLNRNLQPLWFHQVERDLSRYGLDYIGHAQPHMNAFGELYQHVATKSYNEFCKNYDDPVLRQEMIGLLLDLPVRMDVFGKNLGQLGSGEVSDFSDIRIYSLAGFNHEMLRKQMNAHVSVDLLQPLYSEIMHSVAEHDAEAREIVGSYSEKYGASAMRHALLHLFGVNLITFGSMPGPSLPSAPALNPDAFGKHILFDQLDDPGQAPVPSRLLASCMKLPQLDRILLAILVNNDPETVWSRIAQSNASLRAPNNQPITDYDGFSKVLPGAIQVFKQQRLPQLLKLGLLSS